MADSQFVRLPNSKREPVKGAQIQGDVAADELIDVTVRVRRGHGKSLAAQSVMALAATPRKDREHMTREQFAAAHGADEADLEKVAQYATEHGLTAHDASVARRSVHLTGTAEAMKAAFGVELKHYQVDGTPAYRGNADHVNVPADLAGIVEAIVGFDTRPHARPHFRIAKKGPGTAAHAPGLAAAPAATAPPGTFSPVDLAALYNFPKDADGTGQVIGILELTAPAGSGFRTKELQTYFKGLGLGKGPTVTAVSVDGARNKPGTNPNDPNNADGEVLLDIEVAGAVAPKAKIVVYFAPNTAQGFLDVISHSVHDSVNKPTVLSLSWGGPENPGDPTTDQINQILQSAAAMGVTFCVASGDNGSSDDPSQTSPAQVDFPSSSPFALSCGGTKLTASSGKITSEVVWNESTGGAGGGGVSRIFDLPSYQASANVPPAADPVGPVKRGVPDVSGDADPNTGYNILVDGHAATFGGTSAVAPLWAGLIARLNQKLGSPVGFLNPTLYANAKALNDITSGNNGAYTSATGWDPCTGLGTPDGMKILEALSSTTTTPPAPPKKKRTDADE